MYLMGVAAPRDISPVCTPVCHVPYPWSNSKDQTRKKSISHESHDTDVTWNANCRCIVKNNWPVNKLTAQTQTVENAACFLLLLPLKWERWWGMSYVLWKCLWDHYIEASLCFEREKFQNFTFLRQVIIPKLVAWLNISVGEVVRIWDIHSEKKTLLLVFAWCSTITKTTGSINKYCRYLSHMTEPRSIKISPTKAVCLSSETNTKRLHCFFWLNRLLYWFRWIYA